MMEFDDIREQDYPFVSVCFHVNENNEMNGSGERRTKWMKDKRPDEQIIKVARLDGKTAGFVILYPIEKSPWGPEGKGLYVMSCIEVPLRGHGIGKGLMQAAEEEVKKRGGKGIAVTAYNWDVPFMPSSFFEKMGYEVASQRGPEQLMWKKFDDSGTPPAFLEKKYEYAPVAGKVVVDLFHNGSCMTMDIERERVREVAAEFGDKVVLNEYDCNNTETIKEYGIFRGIFVNGKEYYWGYDAPREGIREAINKELKG